MKPASSQQSKLSKLPPSTIFGSIGFELPTAEPTPAEVREFLQGLARVVALVEGAATMSVEKFVRAGGGKPLSRSELKTVVESIANLVDGIDSGTVGEMLAEAAPRLFPRFENAVVVALPNLRTILGIAEAQLANLDGQERNESLDERLARSVAAMRKAPPIELAGFKDEVRSDEE